METSCDETSAAVVDETGIRGLAIASQDAHAAFGGVVPEIAAREHIRALDAMVRHAMQEAGVDHEEVAGVGVTAGPGLVGALLVGVNWAKAYAFARKLPLLGVHHMEGHLFGTALEHEAARPPFIGLLVSGGHTLLLEARAWGRYRLLGQTRDDAAGEAFDKVARRLGLPYPGGPHIQRAAEGGAADRFPLPRPMLRGRDRPGDPSYYDMSFSGLKTAVARMAAECEADLAADLVSDLAAGFQEAVVDVLVEKTLRAVERTGCRRVVLGGGVARNSRLRQRLAERLGSSGELYAPSPRLATDNAAMIAAAARHRLANGERSPWSLNADAALVFPGLV
ncbi:tRNA (adenosine(37)-N6)-threonylcarbamoyltransferase complex transferase subunit TsaD [Candidatus Palauibacter sp.]|uniref:tRNA (adenosine(37)-N6)-threonylcarbamoyltransferase complex transferase subunit TsaD n=1 Tax=Candidatus Palauibacter sp. TaxID=3101350 RepID=UPI003B5CE622